MKISLIRNPRKNSCTFLIPMIKFEGNVGGHKLGPRRQMRYVNGNNTVWHKAASEFTDNRD